MQVHQAAVHAALERLREHVLVWKTGGARAEKWEQNVERRWELDGARRAVMTLLLLRGEQTPGELRGRSDRLHAFASTGDVEEALRRLAEGPEPLVAERARRPGQKESRRDALGGGGAAGAAGRPRDTPLVSRVRCRRARARTRGAEEEARRGAVNPLVDDRDVGFLLYEVHDAASLLVYPPFSDHSRETFDAYVGVCRRFARETLFPAHRALHAEPPGFGDGRNASPRASTRTGLSSSNWGLSLLRRLQGWWGRNSPLTIATAAHLYLMAGACAVYSYAGLTTGAAHLVEAFGSTALKETYLSRLYEGRWTGTMALTEAQAGSSLADVATRATPSGDHFLLSGSKIFISGGDHDLSENIVHMVLARIDEAPAGIKGVSLFLVPKLRLEKGASSRTTSGRRG